MADEHTASPREGYYFVILDTIRRYVADGHSLSIATTIPGEKVCVTFGFEPAAFAAYFQHLGSEVGEADIPVRRD
jgi:hypothetical protein